MDLLEEAKGAFCQPHEELEVSSEDCAVILFKSPPSEEIEKTEKELAKKRAKKLAKKLAKKREQNEKDLVELLTENLVLKTENTSLKQQNTLNRLELVQVKTNMARMEVEISDLKERLLDNEITPTPKSDTEQLSDGDEEWQEDDQ